LSHRGIRVTALCPGPVATEFQMRAGLPGDDKNDILAIPARRVAELGYRGLKAGRRVVVAGLGNQIAVFFLRFMPHAFLMRVVEQRMR
jgi:hypothetical protein